MNYFTKRNSRTLTILLALVMLMTLLAGCFGSKAPEDTTPSTESNVPPGLVEVKPTEATTVPTESTPAPGEKTAVVTVDQLTVRSSPSVSNNPIGYLDKGDVVTILRTVQSLETNWALTNTGWVVADYLDFNYDPEFTNNESGNGTDATEPDDDDKTTTTNIKGVISATELYIRDSASADGKVVDSYVKGDVVTILEQKNGWGRTNLGWVSMKYVTTSGVNTNYNEDDDKKDDNTQTNTVNIKGIVNTAELNIRKEANVESDRVGGYTFGNRVTILETKNGWGRTDKGWISLNYVYQDGTSGKNTAKGIVTGDTLNIRTGPGTNYDRVKSLKYGDRVNILEQFTINGTTWACIKDGWICMDYIYVDGTEGEGAGAGTVTGDQVNLRSGPGTGYESKGSVNTGDTVQILAIFKIGDKTWGCTSKGWICMDYVTMG